MKALLRKKPPQDSTKPPPARPSPKPTPAPSGEPPLYARFATSKSAQDVVGKPRLVVSGPMPLGKPGRVAAQAVVDERKRKEDAEEKRREGRMSPVKQQDPFAMWTAPAAAQTAATTTAPLAQRMPVAAPSQPAPPPPAQYPPRTASTARGSQPSQLATPPPRQAAQPKSGPALSTSAPPAVASPPSSAQPLPLLAGSAATGAPFQNARDALPSPPTSPLSRPVRGTTATPPRSTVSSIISPRSTKGELPALPVLELDSAVPIAKHLQSPTRVSVASPSPHATPLVPDRSKNDAPPPNVYVGSASSGPGDSTRPSAPTSTLPSQKMNQVLPENEPPTKTPRQSAYNDSPASSHTSLPTPAMATKFLPPTPVYSPASPSRRSVQSPVKEVSSRDGPASVHSPAPSPTRQVPNQTPMHAWDGRQRVQLDAPASQPVRRGSQAHPPGAGRPRIFASQPEAPAAAVPARRGPLIFASGDQQEHRREAVSASRTHTNGAIAAQLRNGFGNAPAASGVGEADADAISRPLLRQTSRNGVVARDVDEPRGTGHDQSPARTAHQQDVQSPNRQSRRIAVPPEPTSSQEDGASQSTHHHLRKASKVSGGVRASVDLPYGGRETSPSRRSVAHDELSSPPPRARRLSRTRRTISSTQSSDMDESALSDRRASKRAPSRHRPITPVSPTSQPLPPLAPPAEIQPQRVSRKSSNAPSVAEPLEMPPSVPEKPNTRSVHGDVRASASDLVALDTRSDGARTPVKEDPYVAARTIPDEAAADGHRRSQGREVDNVAAPEVRPRHLPTPPSPEEYSQARARRRGTWLEKMPPQEVADIAQDTLPTFYPLSRHLQEPGPLAALLNYLSFYDWLVLSNVSKEIRNVLNEKKYLHDEVLERFLGAIGYSRWMWPIQEPIRLSLRELYAYMRGVSLPTHEYAHTASAVLADPASQENQELARNLKKATRAYTRVVLRLRAQAEAEAEQLAAFRRAMPAPPSNGNGRSHHASGPPPSWSAHAAMGHRALSRQGSRAPSPTNSAWSHSTSQVHLPVTSPSERNGSPSALIPRFRSPLFRMRRAPLLQVFVPSPDGDWLSDSSLLECEAELKKAGILGFLRPGDVVWDTAVGDEGNVGRLVWDGRYLIDLEYTYSQIGDLPRYLPTLAFPPSYFHRVIRIAGDKNPICYIDVRFWADEIAANLQLLQDRVKTETPQGNYHTVVRWVHRSSFTIRPPQTVQTPMLMMPTKERRGVDPGWYGMVVVEAEGTNEGLEDLQERCQGGFPPRAGAQSVASRKGERERTVWRILRERSRPGEIWIRAVIHKERLMS